MLEKQMSDTLRQVIEDLPLDPRALLNFKASPELNARASELLELNRENALNQDEATELWQLLFVEELVQSLKVKAFRKL